MHVAFLGKGRRERRGKERKKEEGRKFSFQTNTLTLDPKFAPRDATLTLYGPIYAARSTLYKLPKYQGEKRRKGSEESEEY